MTWLGDKVKLPQKESDALIVKRSILVDKIAAMQRLNGTHRSQAAANGHREDLMNLAKQVTAIDRKLGRV